MDGYAEFSDEELIEKLRDGQEDVADYLMEKYKELVRQKARAMYLIGGETDDLIQEGMIGLFKAVRDYQPDKAASFQTLPGFVLIGSFIRRYPAQTVKNINR